MKQLSYFAIFILLLINDVYCQVNNGDIHSYKYSDFKIKYVKSFYEGNGVEDTKVLIISNSELYSEIQYYIDRYIIELVGESYNPELILFESGNHENLRQFIYEKYLEGTKGCIMIGDLPIAYYHTTGCYTHQPSDEVFPCDLYYMDLDGVFIDSDDDGDYDEHSGDIVPEIWFGRLLASNLTYGGFNEKELMIRYFDKNHYYRSELRKLPKRAMVYVDDDFHLHDDFYYAVSLAYDSIMLYNQDSITTEEHYKEVIEDSTELMQICVHGLPNAHTFIQPSGTYSNMYSNEVRTSNPISHFAILYGCSNAKYTVSNCLASWYTFHKDYVIASLGSGKSGSQLFYSNFYTPFGNGATIGEAFLEWFVLQTSDGMEDWERCCFGGLTLLGDPTLKMQKFQSSNWINIIPEDADTCYTDEIFIKEIKTDIDITDDCIFELISGKLPSGLELISNQIVGIPLSTDTGRFVFSIRLSSLVSPEEFDIQHFTLVCRNNSINTNDEFDKEKVNIFPCPTKNEFFIDFAEGKGKFYQIEIFDMDGRAIYRTKCRGDFLEFKAFDLNLQDGMYFVRIFGESSNYTNRIIIAK